MPHTVFIHCGLHKTGTTSIQAALHERRDRLRAAGVLYPASPDGMGAHHNLAWQVAGDRRFDPAGLTLSTALAAIAAFNGNAVLSSEDFETVLADATALSRLVAPFREIGRAVALVVYFRDPADYAESLYAELLQHGFAKSLGEFSGEIAQTGQLHYRDWVFQFDYARVRAALSGLAGIKLLERDYGRAAEAGSVVGDFLSAISLNPKSLGQLRAERRNDRAPLPQLLCRFVANRMERDLTNDETTCISQIFATDQGLMPPLRLDRVFSQRTAALVTNTSGAPNEDDRCALTAWWHGAVCVGA